MKFDYQYIEGVDFQHAHALDQGQIESSKGFKAISEHMRLTGSDFCVAYIEEALTQDVTHYGLKNLSKNMKHIEALYGHIRENESRIIKTIKGELSRFFEKDLIERVILAPVIGYDIGIGLNGVVAVNLNHTVFLKNYNELISIMIHEAAHVLYEMLRSPLQGEIAFRFQSCRDVWMALDYLIQYEGVGLYLADRFREKNKLPHTGAPFQADYDLASSHLLMEAYHGIIETLITCPERYEAVLRRIFKLRLPHRLGYQVFKGIELEKGLPDVKRAIYMENKAFVSRYLY